MEAKIKLVYRNPRETKAVFDAVSPDNISLPPDLSIKMIWSKNTIIINIKYDGDNFMTFLSTIDDILSCITIVEKTFFAIIEKRQFNA